MRAKDNHNHPSLPCKIRLLEGKTEWLLTRFQRCENWIGQGRLGTIGKNMEPVILETLEGW